MSQRATQHRSGRFSSQESLCTSHSGRTPLREAKAWNGSWCTAMIRHTASRNANGTRAFHISTRTSTAPRREWPGWPMRPLASSITVVSGLAMSCSRQAMNSTKRPSASALW